MRAVLLASLMALTAASASAQDFPNRPISMIVPFAAGGPTDTVARVTAESMGRILGKTVVVENVAVRLPLRAAAEIDDEPVADADERLLDGHDLVAGQP